MNNSVVERDPAQYVTIGIDREIFAVAVEYVREIISMQPITRLPHAPPFMTGMIDVRGLSVPVIDLRGKLGLPSVPMTENTRIIVLDVPFGGTFRTMGIIADRVIEVTTLAEQDLEAPPEIGVRWRSDYIRAIGRSKGAFVIIFDLSRLFSSEETALLDRSCEAP